MNTKVNKTTIGTYSNSLIQKKKKKIKLISGKMYAGKYKTYSITRLGQLYSRSLRCDTTVILTIFHVDVALFAPTRSPGVPHNPVRFLLAVEGICIDANSLDTH